jgi:hypothetical protein
MAWYLVKHRNKFTFLPITFARDGVGMSTVPKGIKEIRRDKLP